MNAARILLAATAFAAVSLPASAAAANDPFLDMEKLGVLAISPMSGDMETPITLTTAGGCPRGTNSITRIYGDGFAAEGENVIGNTEVIQFGSPPNDRMVAPMTITIAEAVRRQATPPTLRGTYTLRYSCQDALPPGTGGLYGAYVGELTIADGKFTALTTTENLPETPAPQAGQEALSVPPVPAVTPRVPTVEGLEEEAERRMPESERAEVSVVDDEDSGGRSNWTVPVAAGGGVLALGVAGTFICTRRPQHEASGSRR